MHDQSILPQQLQLHHYIACEKKFPLGSVYQNVCERLILRLTTNNYSENKNT